LIDFSGSGRESIGQTVKWSICLNINRAILILLANCQYIINDMFTPIELVSHYRNITPSDMLNYISFSHKHISCS